MGASIQTYKKRIKEIFTKKNMIGDELESNFKDFWNDTVIKVPLHEVVISLSKFQIQNIHIAPVQLVAAPGTGKIIELVSAFAAYTFGTAAYDFAALNILTNGGEAIGSIGDSLFDNTENTIKVFNLITGKTKANAALEISSGNSGTTGDGTAKVYVTYRITTL